MGLEDKPFAVVGRFVDWATERGSGSDGNTDYNQRIRGS